MKLYCVVLLLILGSIWVCPSVDADNHSKDRAFIQNAVQKMDAAGKNKDADGYVAFTHPDFVNVDLAGQENTHGKNERRAKVSNLFARVTSLVGHSTISSITFTSEGATVTETSDNTITLSVNGQNRTIKTHSTYRDFWVKSDNGWLEKRSRTIASNKS